MELPSLSKQQWPNILKGWPQITAQDKVMWQDDSHLAN